MSQFEKQVQKQVGHIQLSESERLRMREQLVQLMEYKPIRKGSFTTNKDRPFNIFSFFRAHHISGAMIIALVTSSFGITFAAADALPGDLLYNVKVDINEEVVGAFISGEEKQIVWEQERAERRLQEASQLASEGRLDIGRQEEVSRRFAEHTDNVFNKVLAVETEDPVLAAELSTDFEAALETHEVVLARLLVDADEPTTDEAKELVSQVRTATMRVSELADEAEGKIAGTDDTLAEDDVSSDTDDANASVASEDDSALSDDVVGVLSANMRVRAAFRMRERAQTQLKDAEFQLDKIDAESELRVHAGAQIDSARGLFEQGTLSLEVGEYTEAYGLFRRTASILQKVSQLLEASTLFNISILDDVDASRDESDQVVSTAEVGEKEESRTELMTTHLDVDSSIAEVKALILTYEGYDEQEVGRANSFLKDAMALTLRAEIAIALEQHSKAAGLLENAQRVVENAHLVVEQAIEADTVQEVPVDVETPFEDTPDTDGITTISAPPPDLPQLDVVTVHHTYASGTHMFTGIFYTPTSCFTVEAEAVVAESYPEQITLHLSTDETGEDDCTMAIEAKPFSVSATASAEATTTGVFVNNVTSKFEIQEGTVSTETDTPDIVDAASAEATTKDREVNNILERTIQATVDLLH